MHAYMCMRVHARLHIVRVIYYTRYLLINLLELLYVDIYAYIKIMHKPY